MWYYFYLMMSGYQAYSFLLCVNGLLDLSSCFYGKMRVEKSTYVCNEKALKIFQMTVFSTWGPHQPKSTAVSGKPIAINGLITTDSRACIKRRQMYVRVCCLYIIYTHFLCTQQLSKSSNSLSPAFWYRLRSDMIVCIVCCWIFTLFSRLVTYFRLVHASTSQ